MPEGHVFLLKDNRDNSSESRVSQRLRGIGLGHRICSITKYCCKIEMRLSGNCYIPFGVGNFGPGPFHYAETIVDLWVSQPADNDEIIQLVKESNLDPRLLIHLLNQMGQKFFDVIREEIEQLSSDPNELGDIVRSFDE